MGERTQKAAEGFCHLSTHQPPDPLDSGDPTPADPVELENARLRILVVELEEQLAGAKRHLTALVWWVGLGTNIPRCVHSPSPGAWQAWISYDLHEAGSGQSKLQAILDLAKKKGVI